MIKCHLKVLLITELGDVTQKRLAEELGLNYNHFNKIVNGQIIPTLPVALRIAKKVGKHVDEIWELKNEEGPAN